MFADDIKTNLNEKLFHLQFNNCNQYHSDNDEDCSCSSCECSSFSDENMFEDNKTMSFQSINMSTIGLIQKNAYPVRLTQKNFILNQLNLFKTSNISHINDSLRDFNKSEHFSINYNHPSINSLEESKKNDTSDEFISIENINEQHQSENKKQEFSTIDFEHIYKIIDQSYTTIPCI